jgi:antimicrobial peptide system SdpB family protein
MLVNEGGDQINMILTLLIIPFCFANHNLNGFQCNFIKNNLFLKLNLIAIKIQLSILYLQASIEKIYQKDWNNGTAMYYWFNDSLFGSNEFFKIIFGFLFENNFSLFLITWLVIFFEFFFSISIFMKQKVKYFFFVIAFTFHLLIFLIHGLGTFCLSMTAGLVLVHFNHQISFKQNIEIIKKSINIKNLKHDLQRKNIFQ